MVLSEPCDRILRIHDVNISLFVDDIALQRIGATRAEVIADVIQATNLVVAGCAQLGLVLQGKKCGILTADNQVGQVLARGLAHHGIQRKRHDRVRGMDYTGAQARRTHVREKRIRRVQATIPRLRQIRRYGGNATRLFNTGGRAACLWGVEVDGMTPGQVQRVRQVAGAATRCTVIGRNLALDLALSDAGGPTSGDPYVQAAVGPIHQWAKAVWRGYPSTAALQLTLLYTKRRLATLRKPWAAANGPTAAVLLTLQRLGWQLESCHVVRTREGHQLDMRRCSPGLVRALAIKDAELTLLAAQGLWRQEQEGDSGGLDRGVPNLRPLQAMLKAPSKHGGPQAVGALRSTAINAQWPQARLHASGLVETPWCLLCGDGRGTLEHRHWRCPATSGWRTQWWGGSPPSGGDRVFRERGLLPRLDHLLPEACHTAQVHEAIPLGQSAGLSGDVFTDGSCLHPRCASRRRVGFGVLGVNAQGDYIGAWFGPVPLLLQTAPGAEAYAIYVALSMALGDICLHVDCQGALDHLDNGRRWATREDDPYAGLWAAIWTLIDDLGGPSG